jgi:plasmid stabilization system protein ParE
MTVAFRVIFLRRAQNDIEEAVRHRAERSVTQAENWRNALVTAVIDRLEEDPHRFPLAEEALEVGGDLCELPFGRGRNLYRVLFTVAGETVFVHRIRHAAQDWLSAGDL